MSLDKKYGIPEAVVKRMVNDGVISCSVARHHEIYDRFKELLELFPARTKSAIIIQIADEMHLSEEIVRKTVYTLVKNS